MDQIQRTEHQRNELETYSLNAGSNKITLARCLEEKNLIKLVRENGTEPIEAALLILITDKMELFNIKFRITDVQISFLVDCFLEDYKRETLADLGLCLNNAAKGKYGPIYNVIDPPTVLGWFNKHLDDKAQEREQQKKAAKFGADTHPTILKAMKEAIKKGQDQKQTKGRANNRDQHIKQIRANFNKMDQATLEHYKTDFIKLNYERLYPGIIEEIEHYIN